MSTSIFSFAPVLQMPKAPVGQPAQQKSVVARKPGTSVLQHMEGQKSVIESLGDFIAQHQTEAEMKEKLFKKLEQQKQVVEQQKIALETVRTERAKMVEEQKMMESRIQSLNLQAIENKHQYDKLKYIVDEAQKNLKESEEKSCQLAKWRNQIEERLRGATMDVEGKVKEHREHNKEAEEREARLRAELEEKTRLLIATEDKFAEVTRSREQAEADLEKYKGLCTEKDKQMKECKAEHHALLEAEKAKTQKVNSDLDSKVVEVYNLTKSLKKANKNSEKIQEQLTTSEDNLKKVEAKLAERERKSLEEIEAFKKLQKELEHELKVARENHTSEQRDSNDLRKQLAALDLARSKSELDLQHVRTAQGSSEQENVKLKDNIKVLEEALQKTDEEAKKLSSLFEENKVALGNSVSKLQEAESELQKKIDVLEKENALKASKIEESTSMLHRLEKEKQGEIDELKAKIKAAEKEIKDSKKVAEAEAKKKHDKDMEKNLQAAQEQLNDVNTNHKKEKAALQKELDDAKQQLANEIVSKEDLEKKLASAVKAGEKAENDSGSLKQIKKENTALKKDYAKAVKSCKELEDDAANYRRTAEAALQAAREEKDNAVLSLVTEVASLKAALDQEKESKSVLEKTTQEEIARQIASKESDIQAAIERVTRDYEAKALTVKTTIRESQQEILVAATQTQRESVDGSKSASDSALKSRIKGSDKTSSKTRADEPKTPSSDLSPDKEERVALIRLRRFNSKPSEIKSTPKTEVKRSSASRGRPNNTVAAAALSLAQNIAENNSDASSSDEEMTPSQNIRQKRKRPSLQTFARPPPQKKYGAASRPVLTPNTYIAKYSIAASKTSPVKAIKSPMHSQTSSSGSVGEMNMFADM